ARSRKVATFLAVLELSKDGRIVISEDGESVRLATPEERAHAVGGGSIQNAENSEGEESGEVH
ncbi:MAG: hypothetical protein ACI4JY_08245, partial [Oscillospiraceae bacterium]